MDVRKIITRPIGTNSYIIDGKIVIDPGLGISEYIKQPVKVLLTHGHFDHIMGLAELDVEELYIHPEDAYMLADSEANFSRDFKKDFVWQGEWKDIREKYDIIHTPGHTNGSSIIIIDNWLFTGDTIFNYTIGRTDFEGSSPKLMRDTLKMLRDKLREMPGSYYIAPGHDMDENEEIITLEKALKINPFLKPNTI